MPDALPATPEPDARRVWGLPLLVVAAVALRLGTLAQSPFDIDAALLTAGVRHFDPTAMQPPGSSASPVCCPSSPPWPCAS